MSSGLRSSCYRTDWNWANTENIRIGLVFAVLAQWKFLYCIDRFDHIKANKSKLINKSCYKRTFTCIVWYIRQTFTSSLQDEICYLVTHHQWTSVSIPRGYVWIHDWLYNIYLCIGHYRELKTVPRAVVLTATVIMPMAIYLSR